MCLNTMSRLAAMACALLTMNCGHDMEDPLERESCEKISPVYPVEVGEVTVQEVAKVYVDGMKHLPLPEARELRKETIEILTKMLINDEFGKEASCWQGNEFSPKACTSEYTVPDILASPYDRAWETARNKNIRARETRLHRWLRGYPNNKTGVYLVEEANRPTLLRPFILADPETVYPTQDVTGQKRSDYFKALIKKLIWNNLTIPSEWLDGIDTGSVSYGPLSSGNDDQIVDEARDFITALLSNNSSTPASWSEFLMALAEDVQLLSNIRALFYGSVGLSDNTTSHVLIFGDNRGHFYGITSTIANQAEP